MFRWISKQVYFQIAGESVTLNCADMTSIVGQAEILLGTVGSTVLSLRFAARPNGSTVELSTSNRLTLATSTIHTTPVACSGYAVAALTVLTASGGSADLGILSLAAHADHSAPLDVDGRYYRLGESTGSSGEGVGCCFTANTMIMLADGTERPIESLKIGDTLHGRNVVQQIKTTTLGTRQLIGINGIPAFFSDDHRFRSDNGWVSHFQRDACGRMGIGTRLITASDPVTIFELHGSMHTQQDLVLFDLETDGDHTYYANGFLVHNCIGGGGP